MYLLDTNVISELRKGDRCNPLLQSWFGQVRSSDLFLSVLTIGEVRKGIELLSKRDFSAAASLNLWLIDICRYYDERILPISVIIAEEWGRMNAIRPLPAIDGLIGATAKVFDFALVTRNVDDLSEVGVRLINPFV